MAITPLPDPPSRSAPDTFSDLADAFLGALPTFATEANALAVEMNGYSSSASLDAVEAAASAVLASASAATASGYAGDAEASAILASASAATASGYASDAAASAIEAATAAAGGTSTSVTSLLIETGEKVFATQTQKLYQAGQYVLAASAASLSNYMFGQVVSYSGATLTVDVEVTSGSGTYDDWNISMSGIKGTAGATGATGAIGGVSVASNVISSTPATLTTAQCSSYIHYVDCAEATVIALPSVGDVGDGSYFICYMKTAYTLTIDPDGSDRIILNGVALDDGDKVVSGGEVGNFITFHKDSNDGWTVIGRSGLWSDGGA